MNLSQVTRSREIGALLIAEDPRVRRAMGGLLSAADGFRVVRVIGSVPDALKAAAASQLANVDVAVVDLQFFDADSGLDLVTALSAHGVRVLVLSDRDSPDAPAVQTGTVAVIGTASEPDCVLQAIKAVADGRVDDRPRTGSLPLGQQPDAGE